MERAALRARVQPGLEQDFDAVWEEWSRESGDHRVQTFLDHLRDWALIDEAQHALCRRGLAEGEHVDGAVAPKTEIDLGATAELAVRRDEAAAAFAEQPVLGWTNDTDSEAETLLGVDPSEVLQTPATERRRRAAFRLGTDGGLRQTDAGGAGPAPSDLGRGPSDPTGRYAFGPTIGRGAMGQVFVAEDSHLHRVVAFKEMAAELESQPALFSRFRQEVWVTAQLDHPNIVPVYDQVHDRSYTMKLVRGETLAQRIAGARGALARREPVPDGSRRPQLLEAFVRACDGVAYAHQRGVLHRDLKPDNIMVGSFGQVFVMDWGIARVFRTDVAHPVHTPPGVRDEGDLVLGTPGYLSPEQALGRNRTLDAKSDQYALGLVLYELVSLRPAVTGKTATALAVRNQEGELDPLTAPPGHRIDRGLGAIVSKCTHVDPARRYASVQALADDVRRHLRGQPLEARPDGLLQALARRLARHREVVLVSGLLAAGLGAMLVLGLGLWVQQLRVRSANQERSAVELLGASTQRAAEVEALLLKEEGLLAVVSTLATENLQRPGPATDVALFPPTRIARSASGVEDQGADDKYGGPVTIDVPAVTAPSASVRDGAAGDLVRLAQRADRRLGDVLLRSHSEERMLTVDSQRRRTLLEAPVPAYGVSIALTNGAALWFPGQSTLPDDLDANRAGWVTAVDATHAPRWSPPSDHAGGAARVLTVSRALVGDDGARLGTAAIHTDVGQLVARLLPEHGVGPDAEGWLLDPTGGVLLRTSVPDGSGDVVAFPMPEGVAAVHDGLSGLVDGTLDGVDAQAVLTRLDHLGWTHVVTVPAGTR